MNQISLRVPQSGILTIPLWITKHPLSEPECEVQHSGSISQNPMASQTQNQLIKECENTVSLSSKKKKKEIKIKPRHTPTQGTQVPLGREGIKNCQIIKAQCKLNIESSLSEMHTSSDVLVFILEQSRRVHS